MRSLSALALLLLAAPAALCSIERDPIGTPPAALVRRLEASGAGGASTLEAVRARMPVIPRFENYILEYLPDAQTEVSLAWDDANLYVLFRCFEERVDRLSGELRERDSRIWQDDSVYVMLDPDRDPKTYFHLGATVAGTRYDEKDRPEQPESWDGDWTVQTAREESAWTALFTIPFRTLGVAAPRPQETWRANFARRRIPVKERSVWASIRYHLVEPENWGELIFVDPDAPSAAPVIPDRQARREWAPVGLRAAGTCSRPETFVSAPGWYPAAFSVENPGTRSVPVRVDVLCEGKLLSSHRAAAGPGRQEIAFRYRFPLEGLHRIQFAVYDEAAGRLIARSPQDYARVPRLRQKAAGLKKLADQLRPVREREREMAASLRARLDEAAARARSAEGRKAWLELEATLDGLARELAQLRAVCADRSRSGYAVGVESALTKVLRDEPFSGSFGTPARLSLARNEKESVQVVVVAHGAGLRQVRVSATDLTGPAGAVIGREHVRLNPVDFVKTAWPRYAVEYAGWWPDPLMDNAPFDVPMGALRPVWVTVYAPPGIPAGVYRGSIRIAPENARPSAVPLEVRVRDFDLPKAPAQRTAFALFQNELAAWYGRPVSDGMRREWYAFMLDYRLNPTNIYSKTPQPERDLMEFCVERGLNSFTLACTWHKYEDSEPGRELAALIEDWQAYLKPRGWWDMTYIYGFDECPRDKFGEMRETYGWLKRRFPDLRRMTTVMPHPELKGYVDIWVPLTSHYDHGQAEEYRRDGDEVWTYVCCHPFHPWPNFFIDYPAIDPRIIFWQNWKYNVPGFLYYAVNLWETNRDPGQGPDDPLIRRMMESGKRWPEIPWNTFTCASFNGDGQLLYPGPQGQPLASIRLASIRDGIDDYDYFAILKSLTDRAERSGKAPPALLKRARAALGVRPEVAASMTEYTRDPRVLLAARAELAELIERFRRLLER